MSPETILFVKTVFWILLPLTVFLPIRWSVIAYLLLVQFDVSGIADFSSTALGIENAIKVVAVPTLLLIRTRPIDWLDSTSVKLRLFWLLFAAYASVASLWSPDPLSALKMVGYLYANTVLFVVFVAGWRRNWFDVKSLALVVWVSLLLAIVQTFVLGNDYGNALDEQRFTGFNGAQSFAAFLLAMIVLLMFSDQQSVPKKLTIAGAFVGIILTGSRSIFVGFLWVLMVTLVFRSSRSGRSLPVRLILKRTLLAGVSVFGIAILVFTLLPENRLNELLAAGASDKSSLQDVGSYTWRLAVYGATLEELAGRTPAELVVGSGTSSGGDMVVSHHFFSNQNVDPNRAMHDEFLRCLYEWGAPGLLFFIAFLYYAGRLVLTKITELGSREAWAFLAISVPLLISLTVENVFAESAGPSGVGYSLVLTALVASGCTFESETQNAAVSEAPLLV
jgi:hypothetical protein